MANKLYTKARVFINGTELAQSASVSVKRSSGSNAVKTIALGYAGESPGAPMTEITVSNAVPSADFELNPGQFINNLEEVELSIFAAGRTNTIKGFIIDDNFQMAVESAASLEFNFRGGPSDWA